MSTYGKTPLLPASDAGDDGGMHKIDGVLSKFDGVARAKHFAAAGISDFQLRAALAKGQVGRVARGVYARQGANPTLVAIRSLPAEPACISAAELAGLWIVERPRVPHVAAPHSRKYPGFICHRSAAPPTLLDSVVQALRCMPDLDGLVIAESAVALGKVELSALRNRLTGRNDLRERRLVSMIVPQSQSTIECIARFLLRQAGFHVESQVNIPGMGHLDLMVDGRLGIETDGTGFHMDKASFEEDRRRWNVTTRLGVPTLVVSHALLVQRPREFVWMVRETLKSFDRGLTTQAA
ncbi:type IV toxin-antitoxin system AbiEi family antitoxin domain-containing protein [Arthrobacter sp. GN70]|nr:type IV toxin-antitoxin system AbiEi family antitoxin domain-containing protein [Arthrobacter sp. GN70]